MRIGVQGPYDLYTNFNAKEAVDRIPKVTTAAEDDIKSVEDKNIEAVSEVKEQVSASAKNADVSEIAMRLKTGDGFSYADKSDRIASYDSAKLYSDLEKDEALMQYQYFVGEGEVIDSSEDGIVIQKSGFELY